MCSTFCMLAKKDNLKLKQKEKNAIDMENIDTKEKVTI